MAERLRPLPNLAERRRQREVFQRAQRAFDERKREEAMDKFFQPILIKGNTNTNNKVNTMGNKNNTYGRKERGGSKTRRSHWRKTHWRKTHRRKSHRRKSHRRK